MTKNIPRFVLPKSELPKSVKPRPIKRTGATAYVAYYRNPDGERKEKTVTEVKANGTMRDHRNAANKARVFALEMQSKVAAVRRGETEWTESNGTMTLGDLLDLFETSYTTRFRQDEFKRQQLKVMRACLPLDRPAQSITHRDVTAFTELRLKTEGRGGLLKPATVRKNVLFLNKVFSWALKKDLITTNPASVERVDRPAESRPNPHVLIGDMVARLLAVSASWLATLICFALRTGMDRGEILALEWSNVDRERKLITVPRLKGHGAPRTIPYRNSVEINSILDEAWDGRHHFSKNVFLKDKKSINLEAAKSAMDRAWKAAEIPFGKPWKSLRATFCNRKLEAGVPPSIVAKLMGWKTLYVLEHYSDPSPSHLEDAMADDYRRLVAVDPMEDLDAATGGGA